MSRLCPGVVQDHRLCVPDTTPTRGWVDVMDVTWNLQNLRQVMCEQPAGGRGVWGGGFGGGG